MVQAVRRVHKSSEKKQKSPREGKTLKARMDAWKLKEKWLLAERRWRAFPKVSRILISLLVPIVLFLILMPVNNSVNNALQSQMSSHTLTLNLSQIQSQVAQEQKEAVGNPEGSNQPDRWHSPASDRWYRYQMPAGMTLSQVFAKKGFPAEDLQQMLADQGSSHPLSVFQSGQWIRYKLDKEGQLQQMAFETNVGPAIFQKIRGRFQKTIAVN